MQIQRGSGSAAAALGIIGTGLALALPEQKWIGWLLVAVGFFVFLFDIRVEHWRFRIGRGGRYLHTWGPWLLIIGAPIVGGLWLYVAKEQKLPGFATYAVIRLYDTPEFRRRYVFEFVSSEGAKAAFYLSASSLFTFAVTDIRREAYPLEVKLGQSGIPIDQFVALFCEVGISSNSTTIRILVNEKEVAQRELSFPLNLGQLDWKPGALGAPIIGEKQGGIFLLSEIGVYGSTITTSEVHKLVENVRDFYKQPFD